MWKPSSTAAQALANLARRTDLINELMEEWVIGPLVQTFNLSKDLRVRCAATKALANLAAHASSIPQMMREGVVSLLVGLCSPQQEVELLAVTAGALTQPFKPPKHACTAHV